MRYFSVLIVSFYGILFMVGLATSIALGMDIPDEVWKSRDWAISNSTTLCISAEKLKADYKILEANETEHKATYKIADMPKQGIHATVTYRLSPNNAGNPYKEVGEMPFDEKEYEKWRALLREKKKNFPKPYPQAVVCVDGKEGKQTRYEFHEGVLIFYSEYFEDITRQGFFVQFHLNRQLSNFVKLQNNGRTGLSYGFDEKGNLIRTHDYGPASTKPRPVEQMEPIFLNKRPPE